MNPAELANSANLLAPFPDIIIRMNDAISDGTSDAQDIGGIIALDPSLSASLLRAANSPLYKRVSSVSSIEEAVTVVGMKEIQNLAFAVSAGTTVRALPNSIISPDLFWKHSLCTAIAAETLNELRPKPHPLSMFTAGLLHDIGQLLMFKLHPERSLQVLERSQMDDDGRALHVFEREIFGFDHMEVGLELARLWNFPPDLQKAIEQHHCPFAEASVNDVAVIVHVANSVAVLVELDSKLATDAPFIDKRAMAHLGLTASVLEDAVDVTRESLPELLAIFSL